MFKDIYEHLKDDEETIKIIDEIYRENFKLIYEN